ncbi:hypothetical protein OE88DRAFT_1273728 [Heliocybe sulcata]|uniref:Uncharacterized protein n=1 Tax=Heliocybe sulcata TaxID=5364 RepID=A0A5C3NCL4_9AGAM|nr:hypothetical protein OE88DRAFT_1273728 [Heliocybe sulcata]
MDHPTTMGQNEKLQHDAAPAYMDSVQPTANGMGTGPPAATAPPTVSDGGDVPPATAKHDTNDTLTAGNMAPSTGLAPPTLPPRRAPSVTPNGYPNEKGLAPSNGHSRTPSASSDISSSSIAHETADPISPALPSATHPTVALLIPFPKPLHATEKQLAKLPPFVLYAPLAAPLRKPEEGDKEGLAHKAQRKWQEEEREAREKGKGFKAKAVGLISKGMSATKNSRIEFLVRTPNKKKLKEVCGLLLSRP